MLRTVSEIKHYMIVIAAMVIAKRTGNIKGNFLNLLSPCQSNRFLSSGTSLRIIWHWKAISVYLQTVYVVVSSLRVCASLTEHSIEFDLFLLVKFGLIHIS